MPNNFLTGASGYLGKIILSKLIGETTTLGRTHLGTNHIKSDLSNIPTFNKKFNAVIHNAGKAHVVPKTEKEKRAFFTVNFEGTVNLLDALSANPPDNFIFISTIATYGLNHGENVSEKHVCNPNTPYGQSKFKAEESLIHWAEKNKVNYYVLRLPLVVGHNPPGNLGAIKNAISKGYYFKIKNNISRKSMVLADDVADLIKVIIETNNYPSGIYNLTDGIHPTFNEVELAIEKRKNAKSLSLSFPIVKAISRVGDLLSKLNLPSPLNSTRLNKMTSTLTFDDSKARKELNWNPNPVIPFIQENL
jgi:nucleoside-diphosphate-sugar epimerase